MATPTKLPQEGLRQHFRATADAPPVLAGGGYDELYINRRFDAQFQDASLRHHLDALRSPKGFGGPRGINNQPVYKSDLVPPAELRDKEAEKKLNFRRQILNRFPVLKELVHPDFAKGVDTKAASLVGKPTLSATALESLLADHRKTDSPERVFMEHTQSVRVQSLLTLCARAARFSHSLFLRHELSPVGTKATRRQGWAGAQQAGCAGQGIVA
jgi:hypothetical protein